MGLFDKLKRKTDPVEPVSQGPVVQTPAPIPQEPSAEEKNASAINVVLSAIDKAVMTLPQNGVPDDLIDKYTGELNSFRMQISGIVPREDSTNVYENMKDVFSELPQAIASSSEEEIKGVFDMIRKAASALSGSSSDTDRKKAALQLRYVKTNCVISIAEFKISELNVEYNNKNEEMKTLASAPQLDGRAMFKLKQMDQDLASLKNNIDATDAELDSLRVTKQQIESTLRRLELAPVGMTMEELVAQISDEIKEIDEKLGSEVMRIRKANDEAQAKFAEIKVQNEEIRRTLEETGAWKQEGAEALIEKYTKSETTQAAENQQQEVSQSVTSPTSQVTSEANNQMMVDA